MNSKSITLKPLNQLSATSTAVTESFNQVAHGLLVGEVVRFNSGSWVLAQADTVDNSEALGVISAVAGVDDFTVTYSGRITGLSGLTADNTFFLDDVAAGAITLIEPTGISKPILFATSATAAVVKIFRGVIPSTAPKVYRTPHTYAISGAINVAVGDVDFIPPFFYSLVAGQTASLVKVRYKLNGGTSANVKVQINDVDAVGFTGITVTTAAAETDPVDVALSDNDKISLVVNSVVGSPVNLSFTLFIEATQ